MKKYNVASLFAGVGGICLGFQNAKTEDKEYNLIFANEIDEYACETYKNNFHHTLLKGDINKVLNPIFEVARHASHPAWPPPTTITSYIKIILLKLQLILAF